MAEKPHSISAELSCSGRGSGVKLTGWFCLQPRTWQAQDTCQRRVAKSRKAGHLQPFSQVKLMLAAGRDLWIITQVETAQPFLEIKDDLVRIGYAAYVTELLDRFIPKKAPTLSFTAVGRNL